jgi:hypothetical protein
MSRYLPAALGALALVPASGAALADPITYAGTFSITDISPPHNNLLTVTSTPGSFSVPLYLNKVGYPAGGSGVDLLVTWA